MEGDDVAYLEAAATVDDRAHSTVADEAFRRALEEMPVGGRVLEAGAGTCGVLRRLLASDALPSGEWVAVDTDERVLTAGRGRLVAEARTAGYTVAVERDDAVALSCPEHDTSLRVRFHVDDVQAVAADEAPFDGVVGRSFADLLAPADVLELLRTAAPDGWYHLPLTFDGETRFSPAHPADDAVVDAFHGTMRNHGRAATLLVEGFADAGTPPTADARSDWVVEPEDSEYVAEEEAFIRIILETVVASVQESGEVPATTLTDWAQSRRQQVRQAEVGYVAVNRDLFGRVP